MRVDESAKSDPGNFLSLNTFETHVEMLINKQKHIPVREHSSCELQFSRFTQRLTREWLLTFCV